MDVIDRKAKLIVGRQVAKAYGLRRPACSCGHTDGEHDDNERCLECECTQYQERNGRWA